MTPNFWVVTRHETKVEGSEELKGVFSSKELALGALASRHLQWEEDGYEMCTAVDPTDSDWNWWVEAVEVDEHNIL
ncbi:MAG: hypothetical protein ABI047_11130 [Jatrophihabitantaceae bacterium]